MRSQIGARPCNTHHDTKDGTMPKNTDGTFTLCGSCATRGQCAGRNVCAIERSARLMYDGCSRLHADGTPREIPVHTTPDVWHDDDGIWSAVPGAPEHALGPFASEDAAEAALHVRPVDTVNVDHLDYPAHSPYCMCVQCDEPEA